MNVLIRKKNVISIIRVIIINQLIKNRNKIIKTYNKLLNPIYFINIDVSKILFQLIYFGLKTIDILLNFSILSLS